MRAARLRRPVSGTARAGAAPDADGGRAIIEVTFLGVLLLVPIVYLLIAILHLQAATMALNQAARDIGRLIETATHLPSTDDALAVARVALDDHRVDTERLEVRTVAADDTCDGPEVVASRSPGSRYTVCVIAVVGLPGVPTVMAGSANTVTGVYRVMLGELREGR